MYATTGFLHLRNANRMHHVKNRQHKRHLHWPDCFRKKCKVKNLNQIVVPSTYNKHLTQKKSILNTLYQNDSQEPSLTSKTSKKISYTTLLSSIAVCTTLSGCSGWRGVHRRWQGGRWAQRFLPEVFGVVVSNWLLTKMDAYSSCRYWISAYSSVIYVISVLL